MPHTAMGKAQSKANAETVQGPGLVMSESTPTLSSLVLMEEEAGETQALGNHKD